MGHRIDLGRVDADHRPSAEPNGGEGEVDGREGTCRTRKADSSSDVDRRHNSRIEQHGARPRDVRALRPRGGAVLPRDERSRSRSATCSSRAVGPTTTTVASRTTSTSRRCSNPLCGPPSSPSHSRAARNTVASTSSSPRGPSRTTPTSRTSGSPGTSPGRAAPDTLCASSARSSVGRSHPRGVAGDARQHRPPPGTRTGRHRGLASGHRSVRWTQPGNRRIPCRSRGFLGVPQRDSNPCHHLRGWCPRPLDDGGWSRRITPEILWLRRLAPLQQCRGEGLEPPMSGPDQVCCQLHHPRR